MESLRTFLAHSNEIKMAYLPIPSVTQPTQLLSMAKSVVSVASATFADLLNASTKFLPQVPSSSGSKIFPVQAAGESFSSANPRLMLRIENEALLEDFHSRLQTDLSQLGIDVSSGIDLKISEMGTFEVVGNHPDKAAIEIALDGNPHYFEAMQKIAVNSILSDASSSQTSRREFRLSVDAHRTLAHFV